jgi:hypothetical protein
MLKTLLSEIPAAFGRPSSRAPAFRRRRQTVASQSITNRPVGYLVIAPMPVLAGLANGQLLDLSLDPRPARASTRRASNLRATSLRYQPRMMSGRAIVAMSARTLRPS